MKAQNELQAGVFILGAIALLGLSIWILGQERQIFVRQQEYRAIFKDVQGLSEGAGVRLGGIAVGRVGGFSFVADSVEQRVEVTILLNDHFVERIREDSVVTLQTQGLLGDRFINILPGVSPNKLPPGSVLQVQESADMALLFSRASVAVDNVATLSEQLKDLTKNFDKKTLDSIAVGFRSLGSLAEEIEKGDGLLHKLVFSKKDGEQILGDLRTASSSLSSFMKEIKDGDGLLNALVYGDKGPETIASLSQSAASIGQASTALAGLINDIKTGSGLAHEMVYAESPGGINEVVAKLNDTAHNLKIASDALAKGSGTIGALLVDSQLYDNLVEVTDGAKRSVILRSAIRSALAENRKQEAKDAAGEGNDASAAK
jgi:phospholipid/cholesterol/gamma-HCH transport system substrate-binding protein